MVNLLLNRLDCGQQYACVASMADRTVAGLHTRCRRRHCTNTAGIAPHASCFVMLVLSRLVNSL